MGGGSGEDAVLFAQHGHNVTLIDIGEVDLQKAASRVERMGVSGKVTICHHDLSDGRVPLNPDSCDVIYSRLTLHFFEPDTLIALLRQIYQALKCGGKTYMTLKSPDDTAELAFLAKTAIQKQPGVFEDKGVIKTRFTSVQLEEMLQSAGMGSQEFSVKPYVENLGGRTDVVRSGSSSFLLNEISITKLCQTQ